jgi:hypothetical protein
VTGRRPFVDMPESSASRLAHSLRAQAVAEPCVARSSRPLAGFALFLGILLPMLVASSFISSSRSGIPRRTEMNLKAMAVVASGVVASMASGDAVQWRVEDGGNGHWYEGVTLESGWTWSVAKQAAEAIGGALVSCESDPEWQFVRSRFSPTQASSLWQVQSINALARMGPWIGGTQAPGSVEPSGGWTWLSGVPINPQDNINCCSDDCAGVAEDRLHLYAQQSTGWTVALNDLTDDPRPCSDQIRGAIIEWSSDCNSDGIVDYGQILNGELADTNGNGVPDICEQTPCPGDIATDGVVNGVDLAAVLNNWGTTGGALGADANGDGVVDGADLALVLNSWGPCPK